MHIVKRLIVIVICLSTSVAMSDQWINPDLRKKKPAQAPRLSLQKAKLNTANLKDKLGLKIT